MSHLMKIGLFAAAMALTGMAGAADGKILTIKHGYIACHKVEGKMVGPAYKDIHFSRQHLADLRPASPFWIAR